MSLLGAIATGLGSLFGGQMAGRGQIKGGKIAAKATLKANRQNLRWQKRFAQNAIQWKVRDARKAGIAPLAALGAQTVAFSPSFVGATQAGQGVADAASSMGQGISRAASALGDIDDRNAEYLQQLQKLQLDNIHLQNQALSSQIRMMTQPGNPPPAPAAADRYVIPGQGQGVDAVPNKLVMKDPAAPGYDPGTMNDMATIDAGDGSQIIVPSKDAKAATEDSFIPETQMSIRHNAAAIANPRSMWRGHLGKNEDVSYNPLTGKLTKFRIPEWAIKARDRLERRDQYKDRTYGRGTPVNTGFHGF